MSDEEMKDMAALEGILAAKDAEIARLKEELVETDTDFGRERLIFCERIAHLREAAQRVVDDIHEYERINNLAPNPGRKECWDSVADLVAVLGPSAPVAGE